jgi:hypothetical protein
LALKLGLNWRKGREEENSTPQSRRFRCAFVFAVATLVAATTAESGVVPPCVGDCNEDGVVRPSEIRTCAAIGLDPGALGSCPSCDASNDGTVTVDDVVQAVVARLGPCAPPEDSFSTAGTSSALGGAIGASAGILDIGYLLAGGGGGGGGSTARSNRGWRPAPLAQLMRLETPAEGGAASTFFECPFGGFASIACIPGAEVSRVDAIFIDCATVDPLTDSLFGLNGDQTLEIADPGFCFTGEVLFGTSLVSASNDLELFTRSFDSDAFESLRMRDSVLSMTIVGPGCAMAHGMLDATGWFVTECPGRAPGSTGDCGEEFQRQSLVFEEFSLVTTPQGMPPECSDLIVANGRVDSLLENQSVRYSDYEEEVRQTQNGSLLTQAGLQFLPCLGRSIELGTLELIFTPLDAPCPTQGVLAIADPDTGATATVTFTSVGGVEIDEDADGTPERVFESCRDPELNACFDATPPPTPTPAGPSGFVCSLCESGRDCDSRLACVSCLDGCADPERRRCGPDDLLSGCEDGGVYGTIVP